MMNRIIPVILGLVAFGIFFGYVNPAYSGEITDLQTEIRSYDSALAAAQAFSEKESELSAEQSAIPAAGRERIAAFLPDGVDNVQLILDLQALASRSGIQLSDFDILSDAKNADASGTSRPALASEGAVDSLDISITGLGTYDAFRAFLDRTEWSLRPMDLMALSITDPQTGVYVYHMTFRIYWLR